ncbi:Heterokaryon incompatibility protein 6, OR allele [Madurella mycetomatis]|uniref:Heterokaryon incompatibility protein 6, OR allele n=1 Tax=Madurella mycetomatis TaxID=100816 RepID=A0A175VX05_9PEZI|nr:Heterokaryon incompatibility protein 6, OR allele [Madurella mycetomatis]
MDAPTGVLPATGAAGMLNRLNTSRNEIRVLYLYPSIDPDAPIQCSRQVVSLDDDPEYEALSYAWGNPSVVHPILLDHDPAFPVTLNAWTALRALRYRDQPRLLWIDAICIRQDDDIERAEQVKLMGTIYRKASSVRVWLGADDVGDKNAMSILQNMTTSKGANDTLGYSKAARERMGQLRRFFARPWWERLWVVQEVALGQHVVFQQGSNEMQYKELLAAYHTSDTYFRKNLSGYTYGLFSNEGGKTMEIFESVRILHQTRKLCEIDFADEDPARVREATMTWVVLANSLSSRKATIDKDRLYSLYGLLPESVLRNFPDMEPSYSISTEQAFIDVTYSIMQASQTFLMFSFLKPPAKDSSITHHPQADVLPSWVPDWRRAPINQYESNLRVVRDRLYNASKNAAFHLQRLSASTICLKGFFVTIITAWSSAGVFPSASPMLEGCYNAWRQTWADTLPRGDDLSGSYVDGLSRKTAFRRTVLWDCEPGGTESPQQSLRRLTRSEEKAMFTAHDRAVAIAFSDDHDLAGEQLSARDAQRTAYMMNCVKGRQFFVTSGGLIGLTAQAKIEAGDSIFIVAGNSHPIILRPSKRYDDTWHAVGECYLHGFMDGAGVVNIKQCEKVEKVLSAHPVVQAMKGTERNPRWNELGGQSPGDGWRWLLVE